MSVSQRVCSARPWWPKALGDACPLLTVATCSARPSQRTSCVITIRAKILSTRSTRLLSLPIAELAESANRRPLRVESGTALFTVVLHRRWRRWRRWRDGGLCLHPSLGHSQLGRPTSFWCHAAGCFEPLCVQHVLALSRWEDSEKVDMKGKVF